VFDEVCGHARYTFMDGYAGYNQISIALQDIYKTAYTTLWGTFVWVVMLFKLYNVFATFQRLVMYISTDLLLKSMTVFVDDFSTQSNANDHLQCVREALIRFRKMQLAEKEKEPDPEKIMVIEGNSN
jgi:hypothetical protein